MKNVLRFIGVIAIIVSSNVIVLALKGYNENIVLIECIYHSSGFVPLLLLIYAD
jgi:hypothetical protein